MRYNTSYLELYPMEVFNRPTNDKHSFTCIKIKKINNFFLRKTKAFQLLCIRFYKKKFLQIYDTLIITTIRFIYRGWWII